MKQTGFTKGRRHNMRYQVIKTKRAGYAIQDTVSSGIVASGLTQMQAIGCCEKLNKGGVK